MDKVLHMPDVVFLKLAEAASSTRPGGVLTAEEAHTVTASNAHVAGLCFNTSVVTTSMIYAY